jgi:2-polyprenyl-3-methyl-5-hydroxy-6-metoxy-1,4-benzoquinol methylase
VEKDINNLDNIALNYHLNSDVPDMFIENICQDYEFSWIKSFVKESDKILDLGFGDGFSLKYFRDHLDFTIIEGSKILCQKASNEIANLNSGVKVIETYFEEYSPTEKFDVIIASHILEHVEDHHKILMKIHSWLKPSGTFISIVPNSESLHRRLGVALQMQENLDDLSARDLAVGHVRVFDLKTLDRDLKRNGFTVSIHRGFFVKALSNKQMLNLDEKVITGLCRISEDFPTEYCANIGMVARKVIDANR